MEFFAVSHCFGFRHNEEDEVVFPKIIDSEMSNNNNATTTNMSDYDLNQHYSNNSAVITQYNQYHHEAASKRSNESNSATSLQSNSMSNQSTDSLPSSSVPLASTPSLKKKPHRPMMQVHDALPVRDTLQNSKTTKLSALKDGDTLRLHSIKFCEDDLGDDVRLELFSSDDQRGYDRNDHDTVSPVISVGSVSSPTRQRSLQNTFPDFDIVPSPLNRTLSPSTPKLQELAGVGAQSFRIEVTKQSKQHHVEEEQNEGSSTDSDDPGHSDIPMILPDYLSASEYALGDPTADPKRHKNPIKNIRARGV